MFPVVMSARAQSPTRKIASLIACRFPTRSTYSAILGAVDWAWFYSENSDGDSCKSRGDGATKIQTKTSTSIRPCRRHG